MPVLSQSTPQEEACTGGASAPTPSGTLVSRVGTLYPPQSNAFLLTLVFRDILPSKTLSFPRWKSHVSLHKLVWLTFHFPPKINQQPLLTLKIDDVWRSSMHQLFLPGNIRQLFKETKLELIISIWKETYNKLLREGKQFVMRICIV